ncbi:halocyanin domain-containing protein [Haloarcula salinisoli]|uniref:Halocyanin domain-containing protein n=1 Tax=Haloarcula salinisoli TaxID=2487746 RepID=A0A8J7YK08_9EURY|nr:halocyanin domain-containing protein [Halomicroarcula salinisoli]MBX0286842.1 halocyanin domain-containing protein [Halomicroarcula salinisoli]MBX0304144.1 halocyanin domain-containing protein [Halomicroarcula salinisoli]
MASGSTTVSRRAFMLGAAGVTATAATGSATAQEGTPAEDGTPTGTAGGTPAGTEGGNETGTEAGSPAEGGEGGGGGPPDFGGFLDDVGNFDGSVTDAQGQDQVSVAVGAQGNGGAFAFDPPAVHVDNGATVVWEWTGQGGGHNVVEEGGDTIDSGEPVATEGETYEVTFDTDGIYNYVCEPHVSLGMKGSVVVGTDYPTASGGGGGGGGSDVVQVPNSAKTLGIATTLVAAATLGLTYVFMRYGGDYEMGEQ